MKKIRIFIFIFIFFVLLIFFFSLKTEAQVSIPNFFKKIGNSILFVNSSWHLGSSSNRITKGWFADLDTTNISIGGTSIGNLDMNNNLILNIGHDNTDFTTGGGLNLAGNLLVGTNAFYVNASNGNVGIGTTGPGAKLDVAGAIKANNHVTHLAWNNFGNPTNGWIKLSTPIVHNESNMFRIHIFGYEYADGSDTIDIVCTGYANSGSTLTNARCQTEGTDLPVEIGTETRADQGNQQVVVIRLGSPTWDWYYPQLTAEYIGWNAKNAADFKWVTGETTPAASANTNLVYINDQGNSYFNVGNVGIGTTGPGYKLQVSGTGAFSDTLLISGGSTLPAAVFGKLYIASGLGSPNHTQLIFGDGTGYRLNFSKRVSGVTTNLVTIKDNGDVGIGADPGEKLDVAGSIYSRPPTYNAGNLFVVDSGGSKRLILGVSASPINSSIIQSVGGGIIFRSSDGAQRMFITEAGNVGIGTTTPVGKLHISGSDYNVIFDSTNNVYHKINRANTNYDAYTIYQSGGVNKHIIGLTNTLNGDYLQIGGSSESSPSIIISDTGNVGIGTTTPAVKLDVNGAIKVGKFTTSSTCGAVEEGAIIYNDVSNYMCFCDGTSYKQFHSPTTDCF